MKKIIFIMSLTALTFGSCKNVEDKAITTTTTATDTVKTEVPEVEKPMDSAAMMQAWQEYATPGEIHKLLASDAGKWNCDMTFWESADAKPEKAKSTAEVKMAFDGKYQESIYKGQVMGMAFEGKSTTGFNNASGKAFSTFYDNMGTGFMYSEGSYDAAKKTMNLAGKMTDPMTKKTSGFREEYVFVDNNTRKMSMFDTKNGIEFKSMEIVMTRSK